MLRNPILDKIQELIRHHSREHTNKIQIQTIRTCTRKWIYTLEICSGSVQDEPCIHHMRSPPNSTNSKSQLHPQEILYNFKNSWNMVDWWVRRETFLTLSIFVQLSLPIHNSYEKKAHSRCKIDKLVKF